MLLLPQKFRLRYEDAADWYLIR